ncbi:MULTISPECIES: sodium:calcium symporter [unclassified Solwaraspora]|uniref:sodium:calcium antiporter n=1 Tax=unclassified Solwaraspora TaxID=2627926 RepID=UPI00248CE4D8|nr:MULTISPECIES: sodium:calcium symporter [unclassified Solwaraspora]WBB95511.1 sodium:calcium symporter [Solwaraspora sp. WMMA2059]WBC20584.1 sodium:calcium symporter [Solwaraspora sp. WMMA2080]WJK37283.1 sodium:calcium symporter [Solwaraspora sp. WMMA2065]
MTGSTWPLAPSIAALAVALLVIVFAGKSLAATADTLADRTGMGEAVAGALLLGAVTSLPGIATTAIGAWQGDAQFAIANPIGGIAVQTVWLAIADLLYRRSNIEHAAASLENIMQALVLVALLCLPIVAYATPGLTLGWVHPASLLIPVLYLYGLHLVRRLRQNPMWRAEQTSDTRQDVPDDPDGDADGAPSTRRLWWRLAALAAAVGGTGYLIGQGGLGVIAATGLPSGFVGFTVTTAITSLPELVTLIAAVRIGALTLGIGNILGGNAFDSLMIFLADAAYRPGSVYADAASAGLLLAGSTTLLTVTLAAGLLLRERRGVGFEGVAIPVVYLVTVVLLLVRAA